MDHHAKEFGYKESNVSFVQGYIEALTEAGLEKNSFDIIMCEVNYSLCFICFCFVTKEIKLKALIFCHSSNCVVNLSPDKKRVLAEAYSVLKVHCLDLWLLSPISCKTLTCKQCRGRTICSFH